MRKRSGNACDGVTFFPLDDGLPAGPVEDITHLVFTTAYQNDNFASDTPITRSVIDGNRRRANVSAPASENVMYTHSGVPQPICPAPDPEEVVVSPRAPATLGRESATEPNNDEIPVTPCDEDQSRDNVPMSRTTQQSMARYRPVTNEILAARKMDSTLLHDEVYGKGTRAYEFNVEHQLCAICTTIGTTNACPNAGGEVTDCSSCLAVVGGFQVLLGIRRQQWMLEPNHSRKRRRGKAEIQSATVRTRGGTKQRKIRLVEMLRNSLRGEQELDEHGQVQVTPTQKYFLPLPNGSTTEVCRPFFCLALGTTPRSTAFKNAIRAVQETVLRDKDQPHLGNIEDMNAIPDSLKASLQFFKHLPSHAQYVSCSDQQEWSFEGQTPGAVSRSTGGLKTQMLLAHLLEYVQFYTEPMPHEAVLRFEFISWVQMHETLMKEYEMRDPANWKTYACSRSHMLQMLKHPIVLDAIAIKTGCKSHDDAMVMNIPDGAGGMTNRVNKVKCNQILRKLMFGKCTRCALLAQMRKTALLAKDRTAFMLTCDLSRQHKNYTMNRKQKYYNNKKDAIDFPTEVLTIIVDGMSKWNWDSPCTPRRIRHSKEIKEMPFFEYSPDGALVAGLDTKFMFLTDALIGGTSSGMNKTLDLILRILDILREKKLLPSSNRRRVLNLQFDNCGVNKNYLVFVLASMLVYSNQFTAVNVDYMHVGHTHEDIDQWFSVLKQWFNSVDVGVGTTEKLMQALRDRYPNLHIEELVAIRDFAAFMTPFAIKQTDLKGHSKGYSFRFFKDNQGQVIGKYQTDENIHGQWYNMNVMERYPEEMQQEVANMPLVTTTRIVQIVGGTFLDDHDVEQTTYGVAKTIETMKGAFKCGIASSSLHSTPWYTLQDDEWWQEKLRNCMDSVWLQKNRVEPLGPKVNWGDMPICTTDAQATEVTEAELLRANPQLLRQAPGPCIQSMDIRGTESMMDYLHQQWAMWHISERQRQDTIGICKDELPHAGELVVFAYQGDEDHHGGRNCFVLGKVILVYLTDGTDELIHLTPTSDSTQYPLRQWQISVQNYRPERDEMRYAIEPRRFSSNKFEFEMESEDDYIERMAENRATRKRSLQKPINKANLMPTTCQVPGQQLLLWNHDLKTPKACGSIRLSNMPRNAGIINAVKSQFPNIRERVAWICKHYKCVRDDRHCATCASAVLPRNAAPSTAPRATAAEATGLTADRYQSESLQGEQDDLNTRQGPMTRASGLNFTMQQEHAEAVGGLQLVTD